MRRVIVLSLLCFLSACTVLYPNGRVPFTLNYDKSIELVRVNGEKIVSGHVYYAHRGVLEIKYIKDSEFGPVEERVEVKIWKKSRYFLNDRGFFEIGQDEKIIYK